MDSSLINIQNKSITEGPILKSVISLAAPVAMGMFMEFALSTTDYFWVGKLGPTAQDSITSSLIVIWTILAITAIISVGLTALISRNIGSGNIEKVIYFIKQGFALAIILGISTAVTGTFLAGDILEFMKAGAETIRHGTPYLRIFFASVILLFLMETSYAIFRASGDTRTPMKVGVIVVVINMILDPLLIFGAGPIPALGVAGASLATAIAFLSGTVLLFTLIYKGKLGYKLPHWRTVATSLSGMLKIVKIGLPMSSHQLVFMMVYWFLIIIVHSYGVNAGAAMGIGNRMESFCYLIGYGISLAAATMVGQNLGAGKPDRAARCAWYAVGLGVAVSAFVSIFFFVIPRQIVGIFSNDPYVVPMATDYLIILGLSQITMTIELVLEGSFTGAGDTIPPMLVMVPGHLLRIPLAYYLCFTLDLGLNGVWWTLTITTTIKAIILAFWFRRGKWKEKII